MECISFARDWTNFETMWLRNHFLWLAVPNSLMVVHIYCATVFIIASDTHNLHFVLTYSGQLEVEKEHTHCLLSFAKHSSLLHSCDIIFQTDKQDQKQSTEYFNKNRTGRLYKLLYSSLFETVLVIDPPSQVDLFIPSMLEQQQEHLLEHYSSFELIVGKLQLALNSCWQSHHEAFCIDYWDVYFQ